MRPEAPTKTDRLAGIRRMAAMCCLLFWGALAAAPSTQDPVVADNHRNATTNFEIPDTGGFYTNDYPCLFFHNMAGFGIYPYSSELLGLMTRFDAIWSGNVFPLPPAWVEHLHTAGGRRRSIIFYELFTAVHFIYGKDNPQPYEAWQIEFLDNHKSDFYSINPLLPPSFTEFSPGRHLPGSGLLDYFINYGVIGGGPEEFLANQYYDNKRAQWGYDGIFLDLVGSAYMAVGDIQDPNNPDLFIGALDQYNALSSTRADPTRSYDQNGAAFLALLRQKDIDTEAFPIWGNQAYRSGDFQTGENPYYKYLQADLDESTFTSWYNPGGWTTGARVLLDGVWYENANPIETRIMPFDQGVANLQPLIRQLSHAKASHDNPISGVLLNYVRPYYRIHEDGFEAVVDREAIHYSYATGKVLELTAFAWDFFDTFLTIPGVPGAPGTTGLPPQGYYRWAFDPIYFLDLGDRLTQGYETIIGSTGGKVEFVGYSKGFIVINSSAPARDVTVDFSGRLLGAADGVFGFHDHSTGTITSVETTSFEIPAAYYAIGKIHTNSARIFSYVDENGSLISPYPDRSDSLLIH